jgi:hypothetical protein
MLFAHNISKIQLKIMYGFCRITDLGYFTFQFFKPKLRLKSIYMLWESCSSSYRKHNKIEFAFFGFFYDFILNLQVAVETQQR